jgi:hypothetical protein
MAGFNGGEKKAGILWRNSPAGGIIAKNCDGN